jgi:hypothetical protein
MTGCCWSPYFIDHERTCLVWLVLGLRLFIVTECITTQTPLARLHTFVEAIHTYTIIQSVLS